MDDFWNTVFATLGAIGGVGAIATGVSIWISNHTSKKWLQENQTELNKALADHKAALDEQMENHRAGLARQSEREKLRHRREEIIFAREIEAADAFFALRRVIWPRYRSPGMDSYEAASDVAGNLSRIEDAVDQYLTKHSVALNHEVSDKIQEIFTLAATEKFDEDGNGLEPGKSAISAGEKIMELILQVDKLILDWLRR